MLQSSVVRGCVYGIPPTMTATVCNSLAHLTQNKFVLYVAFCSTSLFRNAFRHNKLLARYIRDESKTCVSLCGVRQDSPTQTKTWCRDIFLRKILRHWSAWKSVARHTWSAFVHPVRDAYWFSLVRPYGRRYSSAPTAHIFVKFHIGDFADNPSRKTKFA